MKKINIAVIYGGTSNEHEVSVDSGSTVLNNLNRTKYNIIPIYISKDGKWYHFTGSDIKNINTQSLNQIVLSLSRDKENLLVLNNGTYTTLSVDIIFPALLGKCGEDGTVQGLFEIAGIPYVGCGVLSSSISMDKVFTNDVISLQNIPQPPYMSYKKGDKIDTKKIIENLGLPCFIKPVRSGSSVGISKAKTEEELQIAIGLAFEHDNKIIFEKNIVGRELKCAVLGTGEDDTVASYPGETIFSKAEFYDYNAKYSDPSTRKQIPADVDENITEQVKSLSIKIFKTLGCVGLARVDFFLEEGTNNILFNEINTFPAFTEVSMYPQLCKHMGYPIEALLDKLIDIGLKSER